MGLKIKVHYTFYIFLFFSVYFCDFFMFYYYFISLVIHELSHHFMSRTTSKLSQTITLFPFGLALNVNENCENKFYNFLIFFIGPFVNILIALICIALWWVFPTLYFYLKNLCLVNLSLGLFNLIPLQPLDGGNIFLLFFKGQKKYKIIKIMKRISLFLACVFLIIFLYSIFTCVNFSFFCISFFLMCAGISSPMDYNKFCESMSLKDIKECKIYVVKVGTNFNDLKKYFDRKKYVQFYFVNDKNKIVKIISQDDVLWAGAIRCVRRSFYWHLNMYFFNSFIFLLLYIFIMSLFFK